MAAPTITCWHVSTARGDVYGVAALTRLDALAMAAARLTRDEAADVPTGARNVGKWDAPYGTVLAY